MWLTCFRSERFAPIKFFYKNNLKEYNIWQVNNYPVYFKMMPHPRCFFNCKYIFSKAVIHNRINQVTSRVFLCSLTVRAGPTPQWGFIRLSKGYHHCNHLSGSRHRLLHLPDTRCTKQRWQSIGPVLFDEAEKKEHPVFQLIKPSSGPVW